MTRLAPRSAAAGVFAAAVVASILSAPLPAASATTSAAAPAAAPALKAGVFDPARPAPDFRLRGSDGADLTLERFRGKAVLLAFGYSHCNDVCPVTLATLAAARKSLGADAKGMQVVYITVDPDRDTPARLKTWLAAFDPSFVGGTGTADALAAVRKSYGVDAKKIPRGDGEYGMAHSSSVWLIDPAGRLRAMMPYGHEPQDFAHDVRLLLAGAPATSP
jgi:protein SCO1/2